METKANYVVIGAFTLTVAVAALLFGLFAARYATDTAWSRFEIVFEESVIGLSSGSPVLYNGVNVGRVSEIELNPADVREVLVTTEIQADVPVHTDTVATIRLTGLTGTAAIQLSGGSPEAPLLETSSGDPARIDSVASPLNRLLESSEGIVVTANNVMNQLSRLLDDDNIGRVTDTLSAVESFSARLSDPDSGFNRLIANGAEAAESLPALIERLDGAADRFTAVVQGLDRGLIDDLPELRTRLAATLEHLESVSGRIDTIVASNQQELSRIGGVGMRQIDGGLEDLRTLIRDMSELVRRIERNPARFIAGGEQPEEYQTR